MITIRVVFVFLALVLPERFDQLTLAIFNSLAHSNSSLESYFFPDHTINFDNLGISSIESDTFTDYLDPVSTIILSSNFLSSLPNNLFEPFNSTLIHLNLQRNQFHSLRYNYFLRSLQQLRTLDLSENLLNKLYKQDFTGLRRLETLILRKNQLTSLSYATFSRCRTITTLDLSDNHISRIETSAFRSLYRLKTLLLANNPLGQRALVNHLFEPLKNLEFIDLENTQLDALPSFLFIFNERLNSVKLRRNYFQTSTTDANQSLQRTFCGARSLAEVDLVSTDLRSLDVCTYDQVPSLRRLYLMNNPLDCTCDLFYLKYGDIYRVLLTDGNGVDREHTNIDRYLDRWITRPELRRHLEISYERGDFHRLPIELSLFARCATPIHWQGREISNITGIYEQCRDRWSELEEECNNYCQSDREIPTPITRTGVMSAAPTPFVFCIVSWSSLLFAVVFHL